VSPRVLFTSWPFEGHLFPLLSIALAERERGGDVAVFTSRRWEPILASQKIDLFAFSRVEGVWNRVHELERTRPRRGQSLRVQREAFREWLVESIPDQVADLREVIDRWSPDVIITDGSMWGPSLVLHEATPIPVAFASTLLYALIPGPDVPLPGLRRRPPRSPVEWALARGAVRATDWLARGTRSRLDQIRGQYGLTPLGCSVNEFMARLPLYLIGSVRELDLGRTDLPPSVQYVGPLVWHPEDPPAMAEWLDALPTGRPWVHVTEGTSHRQEPFLLRAAARGLAGSPLEAILTTGGDRAPETLGIGSTAPNVHLARWISHTELLPRCAAVVTTGGAQTIVAALQAGVPLVIVPTGWDKPANAMRAAQAGVAISVPARRCTPERLRAAVGHVINESSYRNAARRIADRMNLAPGPDGATELIERVVLDGGASSLTPAPAGGDRA
jgi:MGT family glycosyltransferase